MPADSKEFIWYNEVEHKGIIGTLDVAGVVSFAVEAGDGSSVRGTAYFNAMMDFFGDEATSIHCMWRKGPPDQVSTNIDKVNELTSAGIALDEALQHAWTVTRAKKRGFAKVRVFGTPTGNPGAFSRIEVVLER
jgi:hypothetical protein